MNNTGKDIVVIGGGLGGLMTGALLAKEGFRVTVLEKNHIIGGGLQCFHRHGSIFETGMHILGGFMPGGTLHKICAYLGIIDQDVVQVVLVLADLDPVVDQADIAFGRDSPHPANNAKEMLH